MPGNEDYKFKYYCPGCERYYNYFEAAQHADNCPSQKRKTPQINRLTHAPDYNKDCQCDTCRGGKICPNPKCNAIMRLNKSRDIWVCSRCNCFDYIYIDKNHKDAPMVSDLSKSKDVIERFEKWQKGEYKIE